MSRRSQSGKAIWVLVILGLLVGSGGPELWAGEADGVQLVMVLDLPEPPRGPRVSRFVSQAADLLVHLLNERHYVGLVARGKGGPVLLPAARLSPDHRKLTLKEIKRLTPAAGQAPLTEVLKQALGAFDPKGPAVRALLLFTDGSRVSSLKKANSPAASTEAPWEVITQAQEAKVAVYAAVLAPMPNAGVLKNLTAATMGRFWEFKGPSTLHLASLKLYEYLEQPQQAPLSSDRLLLDPRVKEAVLVASRSASGRGVVLTSPSGGRITSRSRSKTIRWTACQAYDLINISQPRPGFWSLARARPEVSRIFLNTDLKLLAPQVPREVGEDEAVLVAATLQLNRKVPVGSDILKGANFTADLEVGPGPSQQVELKPPGSEAEYAWPAGARVGQFPPQRHPGKGTIRLLAQGKAFQRQVTRPLTIGRPWFRASVLPAGKTEPPRLCFQPAPGRLPEKLEGTVTLRTGQGTLAGALVSPAPGAKITLPGPFGRSGPSWADLRLTGTTPGGRPLVIASAPTRLKTESPAAPAPPPTDAIVKPPSGKISQSFANLYQKFRRRGLWLGLIVLGLAAFLTATGLYLRQRLQTGETGEEEASSPSSRKNLLRLKAQMENLTKEKGQLQMALEEKGREVSQLKAENADLEASLARQQERSQTSMRSLEDLEKKLEDTVQESKAVQEEYMALFARNEQEKSTLKKN